MRIFPEKRAMFFGFLAVFPLLFFTVELPVIVASSTSSLCCPEFFNQAMQQQDQDALDGDSIGMTVWNVHKTKDEGWQKDLLRFTRQSDLLVLQEGYATKALGQFFSKENLYWSMASTFRYRDIETGVVTGSSIAPSAVCSLFAEEPLIKLPKGIQITKYKIASSSEQLVVANVHLVNFALGLEEYSRQLQILTKLLDRHKGPMIVAGDFNSWSSDRQDVVEWFRASLGLREIGFSEDYRTAFMGYKLDHILARGIEVNSAKTVQVASSDHNPLLLDFSVK